MIMPPGLYPVNALILLHVRPPSSECLMQPLVQDAPARLGGAPPPLLLLLRLAWMPLQAGQPAGEHPGGVRSAVSQGRQ